MLPPTFACRWTLRLVGQLLRASGLKLPLLRVLHLGDAVRFTRWPTTADTIEATARIQSIDATDRRTIVTGRIDHHDADGPCRLRRH